MIGKEGLLMKNLMKRVIAVCLVASFGTVLFGCGDKNKSDESSIVIATNIPEDQLKSDLTFTFDSSPDSAADATEAPQDATEAPADSSAEAPATEVATQVVTEYVPVTDAEGQNVTDEQGAQQTEVVTEIVTEYVEVTEAATEAPQSGTTYSPEYDVCTAFWFDTSQQKDFFFEGEFLVIDFKINETTPDGNYPIEISKTDIGSWELVTQVPSLIHGEVAVGNATPSSQAVAGDGFTLSVNNVTGQPGDTVSVVVDLKNNPGFVGFIVDVKYDKNALTIVDTRGGADFDAAISYVN